MWLTEFYSIPDINIWFLITHVINYLLYITLNNFVKRGKYLFTLTNKIFMSYCRSEKRVCVQYAA